MVGKKYVENRRNFFRVSLDIPMCSKLTILYVNGKEVSKGYTPICIEDIGAGGVRFKSRLDIPVNNTITLGIDFSIYEEDYLVPAVVVWKKELYDGLFEYGCKFDIVETEREKYIAIFNKFSVSCSKSVQSPYKECNPKRCKLGI